MKYWCFNSIINFQERLQNVYWAAKDTPTARTDNSSYGLMYHMQLCFACLVPSHYHILVLYFAVCVSEFSTCNTSGFFPVACGSQQPLVRCRRAWSSVCPKCNKKDFHGPSSTFTDCSICTVGQATEVDKENMGQKSQRERWSSPYKFMIIDFISSAAQAMNSQCLPYGNLLEKRPSWW